MVEFKFVGKISKMGNNKVTWIPKEFLSFESYNSHCHSRHPKQPMYPELSLILQMTDFEPKGNPWE